MARAMDDEETREFCGMVHDFLDAFTRETSAPSISEMNRRMQPLLDRADEIGDSVWKERGALLSLRAAFMEDWRKVMDPAAATKLDRVEKEQMEWRTRLRFGAQVNRRGSPIKSDHLVPALLSETPADIRGFVALLGTNQGREGVERIRERALQLLARVQEEGAIGPDLEAKISALGLPTNRPQ